MIRRIMVVGKRAGQFQLIYDVSIKASRTSMTSIVIQMEIPQALVEVWEGDSELTITLPDDYEGWPQVCNWIRDRFSPTMVHVSQIYNPDGGVRFRNGLVSVL